jgi:hypothetical protein
MATMAVVHRHGQTLPDLSQWPVGPWRFACMWSLCCMSNVNDVPYNNVLERVSWDWRWIMSFVIANVIERESLGLFQRMTKLQNQPLGCLQQWAHTKVEWNQMGQVAQIQMNQNSSVQQAPFPYHGTNITIINRMEERKKCQMDNNSISRSGGHGRCSVWWLRSGSMWGLGAPIDHSLLDATAPLVCGDTSVSHWCYFALPKLWWKGGQI